MRIGGKGELRGWGDVLEEAVIDFWMTLWNMGAVGELLSMLKMSLR